MLCDLHVLVCNDYNSEEKGLLSFLQVSVSSVTIVVFTIIYSHCVLLVFDVFAPNVSQQFYPLH